MREMGDETRIVRRLGGQVGSVLLTGEEWCLLGSRAAIRLNQFPARSVQCTAPEAYAFAPQLRVGHFQHDAAHVLICKEVIAGELELVQGALHVEEEWIAPPAREETVADSLGQSRLRSHRNRCPVYAHPAIIPCLRRLRYLST